MKQSFNNKLSNFCLWADWQNEKYNVAAAAKGYEAKKEGRELKYGGIQAIPSLAVSLFALLARGKVDHQSNDSLADKKQTI